MDHRENTSLECFNGCDRFGTDDAINDKKLHGGTGVLVEKFLHDADILKPIYTATANRSMDDRHLSPLYIGNPIQTSTGAPDQGLRSDNHAAPTL